MADASLLEIRDLHAYYGQSHILQGIDLTLRHEPLALLGRNGMGKTTLWSGAHGTSAECSRFDSVRRPGARRGSRRIASLHLGIGYVPQGRRIFPRSRSRSISGSFLVAGGCPVTRSGRSSGCTTCSPVGRTASASGWNALTAASSRCLRSRGRSSPISRLLVMDEPSEGLAPVIVDQLVATLRQLAASGLAILLVEQRLAVATAIASRIAIMLSGRIVLETSAEELLARSSTPAAVPRSERPAGGVRGRGYHADSRASRHARH